MKRRTLIILTGILLALLLIYVFSRNQFSTFKPELKDFALEKPDEVTKVFLSKRDGGHILLEKNEEGQWILNGKYAAFEPRVHKLIYETMTKLAVKSPVPEIMYNRVINELAAQGTKVEIYTGSTLLKTYYVGGDTPDELGTYMYMEGSSQPFVVYIPGVNGYLSVRYFVIEDEWRSRTLFGYKPEQIQQVKVEYTGQPDSSFIIAQQDKGHRLLRTQPGKTEHLVRENVLASYLELYRQLTFEGYPNALTAEETDSIYKSTPFCTITVTDINGNKRTLQLFRKKVTIDTLRLHDNHGNPLVYDSERYYAVMNGEKKILLVQEYMFGKVLQTYSDLVR